MMYTGVKGAYAIVSCFHVDDPGFVKSAIVKAHYTDEKMKVF